MRYVLDSVWNAEAGIQSLGIMEIQNLTYPSSVPASTQFTITYNARNTTTTSQLAFGYIQNLTTGSQIDGSYWEQTVAANTSYPVSTSFPSGIITTLNGEVRLGHVAADTYTLGVSINPVGSGTVSLNPSGPYTPGTIVQMTANPIAGYQFTSWSGDATGSTNPVNITMNNNKSVTANFQQSSYYTLTASSNPPVGGYITLNPSGGTYMQGTSVQITAVANTGYGFDGWSGAISGTTNPTSIIMNGNKAVTANFLSIMPCSAYTTPSDCINNRCFWWISDNKCHDTAEPPSCSTYHGLPNDCVAAGCYYDWDTNQCTTKPPSGGINPMYIAAVVGAVLVAGVFIVMKK